MFRSKRHATPTLRPTAQQVTDYYTDLIQQLTAEAESISAAILATPLHLPTLPTLPTVW